jgi:hypothetical protein
MITINGRKFAEDKDEQVRSLFMQGGTVDGIAKRKGNVIHLYQLDGTLFAAIGRNGHGEFFVSCSKRDNGQTWYQYTLTNSAEEFFGVRQMGLVDQSIMVRSVLREALQPVHQHA